MGSPGETLEFSVIARIESHAPPPPNVSTSEGARGWSMAIVAERCEIKHCSTTGTASEGAAFAECKLISPTTTTLGVVPDFGENNPTPSVLDPTEGPHDVLVLTLETTIPMVGPACCASRTACRTDPVDL